MLGNGKLTFSGIGEGENDLNSPVEPTENEDGDSADQTPDFAPRGASKFQQRIRNKLPKPLDTKIARQGEAIGKIYDACAVRVYIIPLIGTSADRICFRDLVRIKYAHRSKR